VQAVDGRMGSGQKGGGGDSKVTNERRRIWREKMAWLGPHVDKRTCDKGGGGGERKQPWNIH